MNRIGLVTIYSKNYGSVLQCYATKKFLSNVGIECDVLFHKLDRKERLLYWARKAAVICYNSMKYKGFFRYFVEDTKAQHKSINSLSKKSEIFLDKFTRNVLQPRGYTVSQLKRLSLRGEYSYFLAGADQVWNGARIIDPFMFLCFSENNKKISLAPSFGVDKIARFNEKEFKKRIETFYRLSARELSGQTMIVKLTNKSCERVADPVLLLSQADWKAFGNLSRLNTERGYIFVHFLDKPSDFSLSVINWISQKNSLKIICFAYPHEEYHIFTSFQFVDGSPYDYIRLIENASFVCTDSFHTTQFSIIFDRKFYVFERNYTHRNSQQSRLENLINLYSCEDRYINSECNNIERLDFGLNSSYRAKLCEEHDRVVLYLKSALGMN